MTHRPVCVLVNGLPAAGKSTLARALAPQLELPHLSKDAVKDLMAEAWSPEPEPSHLSALGDAALWALLGATGVGGIVETWFGPTGPARVRAGLSHAGIPESDTIEVWCDCPVGIARSRFQDRAGSADRHYRHDLDGMDSTWWNTLSNVEPLGIGTATIHVDSTQRIDTLKVADQIHSILYP